LNFYPENEFLHPGTAGELEISATQDVATGRFRHKPTDQILRYIHGLSLLGFCGTMPKPFLSIQYYIVFQKCQANLSSGRQKRGGNPVIPALFS
jgi:hypothetical protein